MNLFNRVGQIFYGFEKTKFEKQRRLGKPRTPHNKYLCQACLEGICLSRRRAACAAAAAVVAFASGQQVTTEGGAHIENEDDDVRVEEVVEEESSKTDVQQKSSEEGFEKEKVSELKITTEKEEGNCKSRKIKIDDVDNEDYTSEDSGILESDADAVSKSEKFLAKMKLTTDENDNNEKTCENDTLADLSTC